MEIPEQVHKEKRENRALIYGKKGLLFNPVYGFHLLCVKLMQIAT